MATRTAMDDALEQAVEAGRVPGVVAVAADSGGVTYQGAFGKRAANGDVPMTVDTVFWIASMTKAITSVAAIQQVERGNLDLDAPIGEILPELAAPRVLEGFDPAGVPILRRARRPITLRLLLTHTAGFTYNIWSEPMGRYMEHTGMPGIISCQNVCLEAPLMFDPGERWEYGINIDWAGKAVEKVTGLSLNEYFRQQIFEPLGMTDTGFVLGPDQRARLVSMHARTGETSFDVIPFEVPQQPEFFMGGGGLYSTGRDYLTFLQALLNDGSFNGAQILKPETVAEANRNQIGDLNVGLLRTADPGSSLDAEFFPGAPKKWGLAYMINVEDAPTGRSAGSLAWAGLANTYYWLDPTNKVAGVILTQILPFADPIVLDLFGQFERAVYGDRL
ncbi:MAG: serine hydrolase domain-containing protein [Chloroflexota bacterium]